VCGAILVFIFVRPPIGTVTVPRRHFYMVVTARHERLAEANRDALAIRNIGGAGFVVNSEDAFLVVASVYNNTRDANAVAQRLSIEEGFNAEVFRRTVPRVRLFSENFESSRILSNIITTPIELIDNLAVISIDLSAGRITETYALSLLNSKRNNLLILSGQIAQLSNEFSSKIAPIQEFYSTVLNAFLSASNLNFAPTLPTNILHLVPLIIESYYQTILMLQ